MRSYVDEYVSDPVLKNESPPAEQSGRGMFNMNRNESESFKDQGARLLKVGNENKPL